MYQSIHFNAKPRATTNASRPEVVEKLKQIVGAENVLVEPEKVEPYGADAVKEAPQTFVGNDDLRPLALIQTAFVVLPPVPVNLGFAG